MHTVLTANIVKVSKDINQQIILQGNFCHTSAT